MYDDSYLEFDIDDIMRTMEYDLVVRYEPQQPGWQQVNIVVIPDSPPDPNGPCASSPHYNTPTQLILRAGKPTSQTSVFLLTQMLYGNNVMSSFLFCGG